MIDRWKLRAWLVHAGSDLAPPCAPSGSFLCCVRALDDGRSFCLVAFSFSAFSSVICTHVYVWSVLASFLSLVPYVHAIYYITGGAFYTLECYLVLLPLDFLTFFAFFCFHPCAGKV